MFRFLLVAVLFAVSNAFQAPALPSKLAQSTICMQHDGKGFGGGEATRDPAPTYVDPNDPKGKQQAIHKAESFADYLARRSGGAAAPAPAPAAPVYEAAPAPAPAYEAPAPVSYAGEDAAKAAWLAKLGSRGQWGQAPSYGNVVPTQPVYEAAPAAAPAPAPAVEATGSALFAQYLAQRA